MLLKDIMKEGVVTCLADATVREAAKKMANNKVGCLIVADKEKLHGILTKSDIVRSLSERKDVDRCKVSDIMNKNVKTGTPGTNIHDGAKIMAEHRIKRLPIVDDNELVGIVSISELAPCLDKEVEEISAFFWK